MAFENKSPTAAARVPKATARASRAHWSCCNVTMVAPPRHGQTSLLRSSLDAVRSDLAVTSPPSHLRSSSPQGLRLPFSFSSRLSLHEMSSPCCCRSRESLFARLNKIVPHHMKSEIINEALAFALCI
jgi:hypothetical protein